MNRVTTNTTEQMTDKETRERFTDFYEKSYRLTRSLTNAYIVCFNFDLEKGTYSSLKGAELYDFLAVNRGADYVIENWLSTLPESSVDLMREFVDLSTVDERMGEKDIISREYIDASGKWYRANLIVSERKEDGHIRSVTFATQDIDEMKSSELEWKRAIRERVDFLSSIASVFYSIYHFYFEGNVYEELSFVPRGKFPTRLLDKAWAIWCSNDLVQESLPGHEEFLDLSTMPMRLTLQGTLSDEILTKPLGWINVLIVPYRRDIAGNVTEALFLTRIIDERKKAEIRQREELKIANSKAYHDELTTLYNRHGFNSRIDEIFSAPEKCKVAVIMMDIDDFKAVNDTYGHDAGDVVLKNIAGVIVNVLGNDAVYCRWGGEEFNVFLKDADDPVAIAEKIREQAENTVSVFEDYRIKVTLSLGVCIAEDMTKTKIAKLINTADKNLYESKHTGKNKVTSETV